MQASQTSWCTAHPRGPTSASLGSCARRARRGGYRHRPFQCRHSSRSPSRSGTRECTRVSSYVPAGVGGNAEHSAQKNDEHDCGHRHNSCGTFVRELEKCKENHRKEADEKHAQNSKSGKPEPVGPEIGESLLLDDFHASKAFDEPLECHNGSRDKDQED